MLHWKALISTIMLKERLEYSVAGTPPMTLLVWTPGLAFTVSASALTLVPTVTMAVLAHMYVYMNRRIRDVHDIDRPIR